MTHKSGPSKEESAMVRSLTAKLEELRSEKGELERQLEAESESITLKLQRQLSALLEQQQRQQPFTMTASPSSSFPVSPTDLSAFTSPHLSTSFESTAAAPEEIITTLQSLQHENSELRQRLEKTESVSEERRQELVELRKRCGIPTDGLVDEGGRAQRMAAQWVGGSPRTSSILIPGSSLSASPPSSPFFPHARRRSTAGNSFTSASSLKTSLTTPSTSYPLTTAPYPTPSGSSPTNYSSPSPSFRSLPFSVPSPPPPSLASTSFRGSATIDDDDLRAVLFDFDNGTTPSTSPGSKSGSLSRRGSMGGRANVAEQGTLKKARGASRAGDRPDFVDEKGEVEEEAVGELEGVGKVGDGILGGIGGSLLM